MKWLPVIYEHVREAESRTSVFWTVHVPAVLGAYGVFWLPPVRRATGIDPAVLGIAGLAHLALYTWSVLGRGGSRWPRLAGTLAAIVNLGASTAIPALTGRPETLLWGATFAYALVSAVACGLSLVFALLLAATPLLVGVAWNLTGTVPLATSLPSLVLVAAFVVAAYLLVGQKSEEREGLRGLLRAGERAAAVARERERIARELHDSLGASLTEVSRWMELGRAGDEAALARAARRTDEALADLRACVSTFTGQALGVDLLEGMIRTAAAGTCEAANAAFALSLDGTATDLSPMDARHVSLIVAEATRNAVRHGRARAVNVRVRLGGHLRIEVEDDGEGFDPHASTTGLGLPSIRSRARALASTARFEAREGHGMRVVVERSP